MSTEAIGVGIVGSKEHALINVLTPEEIREFAEVVMDDAMSDFRGRKGKGESQ